MNRRKSDDQEWLSANAARRISGWGVSRLQRLAILGRIRTMNPPGETTRYRREDIERLVSERA
jgi:hypothetical protein